MVIASLQMEEELQVSGGGGRFRKPCRKNETVMLSCDGTRCPPKSPRRKPAGYRVAITNNAFDQLLE
jgi:hypothetical protein